MIFFGVQKGSLAKGQLDQKKCCNPEKGKVITLP